MAEKVSGGAAKAPKPKPVKEPLNLDNLRKKLLPFTKDFMDAKDAMEASHGSHVLTISHLIDKASEQTGFPKKTLRKELNRMRRRMQDEATEKEMSEEEREDTTRFRDAMSGTPFGLYAAGKLAKGAA